MCFVSSQKKRGEEFHASRETSQQAYIYQKKKKDAEKSVNRKKEKERRNKQTKCRRKKKEKDEHNYKVDPVENVVCSPCW
jgi:hypothetical protein